MQLSRMQFNRGAVTAAGQRLEAFVGHLDMQVSPFETASQVYRELRGFLKEQGREAARQAKTALEHSGQAERESVEEQGEALGEVPGESETNA